MDTREKPIILRVEDLQDEVGSDVNLSARPTADTSRYVIFTSGSTGLPKGAMVEHKGMLNHLHAKIDDLELDQSSVIAQTASQCFDISVWQFLAALIVGGRVEVFSDEVAYDPSRLLSELERKRVTVLDVLSLMWAMLDRVSQATAPPDLSVLLRMISTGQALHPELCRQWISHFLTCRCSTLTGLRNALTT